MVALSVRPPVDHEVAAELWRRVAHLARLVADNYQAGNAPGPDLHALHVAMRAAASRTPVPPSPSEPEPAPAEEPSEVRLTRRERQVLQRISEGKTNAEIGRELYITEDTVKTHLRRVFRKLHTHDRAHAIAVAIRSGLLT